MEKIEDVHPYRSKYMQGRGDGYGHAYWSGSGYGSGDGSGFGNTYDYGLGRGRRDGHGFNDGGGMGSKHINE